MTFFFFQLVGIFTYVWRLDHHPSITSISCPKSNQSEFNLGWAKKANHCHHHHLRFRPTNQNPLLVEWEPITIILFASYGVQPIRIQSLLSEKRSPSSSSSLVSDQSESALGLARTNHLLHLHCHDSVSCSTNQKPIFVEWEPITIILIFACIWPIRIRSWFSEN